MDVRNARMLASFILIPLLMDRVCLGVENADAELSDKHQVVSSANASSRRVAKLKKAEAAFELRVDENTKGRAIESARASTDKSAGSIDVYVRRISFLVLLAGAICVGLLATVGRKRHNPRQDGSGELELVSTLTLAPRCCLSLVRAQGQSILVARDAAGFKEVLLVPNTFESILEGSTDGVASQLL